jgi:Fe2+-dicitrate sensor, membrane component
MALTEDQLAQLLVKKLSAQLNAEESKLLQDWLEASPANKARYRELTNINVLKQKLARYATLKEETKLPEHKVLKRLDIGPVATKPVHRIHFLKTAWFRYAAAVAIIVIAGIFLLKRPEPHPAMQSDSAAMQATDIAPGTQKAILTLADGRTIVLDNAANGQLAMQQGSEVIKKDSEIIYTPIDAHKKAVGYNTMSTPKGGIYQLTLPDGTRVWLNAASSITYPTAFTGKNRTVKITGEAYFEVTKNTRQPFIVSTEGMEITVMGTRFNVNCYGDEPGLKTTLLSGSVRIASGGRARVLTPGQQARVDETGAIKVSNADIEADMAWKNGYFYFRGKSIAEIMRQAARWYNVDVKIETMPDDKFNAKILRDLPLSEFLKTFELTRQVKFRVEGRQITITQ